MTIRVKTPGLLTTVQDLGRYGYAHLGISPSGAADPLSLRIANLLVGNEPSWPVLEMTLVGATLEFERRAVIALAGAECECKIGEQLISENTPVEVSAGAVLACGGMKTGARLYLAVQGGLDVRPIMGSAATYVAGRFGGFEGRPLKGGDQIEVQNRGASSVRRLRPGALTRLSGHGAVRVTKGAQHEWFGPEAFATLYSKPYVVGEQSDRSGLRLKGEAVKPRLESQLLTDGIPLGAMQVPQDGQPIILLVDQQTTGGYPKITNVIAADIHRVGQFRPRDEVRFAEVSIAEAIRALRNQEYALREAFLP